MTRRYGVARYLTLEQRERAARATYVVVESMNVCERGDCEELGETVMSTRTDSGWHCPLEVALGCNIDDGWDFEAAVAKSWDGSNERARLAAARFIHNVDNGTIGPNDVAAALGVDTSRRAGGSEL